MKFAGVNWKLVKEFLPEKLMPTLAEYNAWAGRCEFPLKFRRLSSESLIPSALFIFSPRVAPESEFDLTVEKNDSFLGMPAEVRKGAATVLFFD